MTNSGRLSHRVISASAGSGKTFQLTNRYIGLMALGVEPERIIALTFSRKAAAEILDKILQRMAAGAASDEAAAALAGEVREAGFDRLVLSRSDVLGLLRRLLMRMHVSRVGTLDSFYAAVIRAFPFEFGLGGDFEILDGHSADAARKAALKKVLTFAPGKGGGQRELLEEFKQATFGRELKYFGETLGEFVDQYHGRYLDAPAAEMWGHPQRIWPAGYPWAAGKGMDPAAEVLRVKKLLKGREITEGQQKRWDVFLAEAGRFDVHSVLSSQINYLLPKLVEVLDDLEQGRAEIVLDRKKFELTPAECRHVLNLVRNIVNSLLEGAMRTTRGLFAILSRYEGQYDRHVRRAGKLGFRDIQFLLAQGARDSGGMPALSSMRDEADRMYIDYRLDSSFDHWLLDEFQDTSTLQWLAMRNLVDEVLQDDSGRRSLFYVGDVKQAIHWWRGGDSSLFHRILDDSNLGGERIQETHLAKSWRSSQAVVDAVNAVFSHLRDAVSLPEGVLAEWERNWRTHETEKKDLPGCVELYEVPRFGKASLDLEARFRFTGGLLEELAPAKRGLSAAVLVRTNDHGKQLVRSLRRAKIPAAWEGSHKIADNPVVAALLSLVQIAAHPGDTFAREHLAMTPLGPLLSEEDGRGGIHLAVLDDISTNGFELLVRKWLRRLEGAGALVTDFEIGRAEELAVAALEFDQTGVKDADEFIDFIRQYEISDAGSRAAVQVMTMHKAKGLEFDIVILPDLEGRSFTDIGQHDLGVQKADSIGREPEWVLSMPAKLVAEADPVLGAYRRQVVEESAYEKLCLLYVSMTRAKRGLYLVTTQPPKSSRAVYASTLVRRTLASGDGEPVEYGGISAAALYRHGDRDWFVGGDDGGDATSYPLSAVRLGSRARLPAPFPGGKDLFFRHHSNRRRLVSRTPSGSEGGSYPASVLFSRAGREGAELGTAVHEMFELVEWSDESDVEAVVAAWASSATADDKLAQTARGLFVDAMAADEVRRELARPHLPAEVWNERSFDVVLDDEWVSGTFDRVTVLLDAGDRPESAVILDYKTDRVETGDEVLRAVATYKPQLALYRRVLARMTGLAPDRIATRLLFVRLGRVVDV